QLRMRRRETQALKSKGLRHNPLVDSVFIFRETQALKSKGLRQVVPDVFHSGEKRNPSPEIKGIKTKLCLGKQKRSTKRKSSPEIKEIKTSP
ncbi:hypothetical protein, partial [Zoogloea ramigera]|uniref:hypothetical protein n=1 Tax=Zoogloea ramigera TaxID=350 RepID=UPI003FA2E0F0